MNDAAKNKDKAEEFFKLLSDQNFLGLVIIQDNIIKYANKAVADIFESTVEDLYNFGPGEFLLPQ